MKDSENRTEEKKPWKVIAGGILLLILLVGLLVYNSTYQNKKRRIKEEEAAISISQEENLQKQEEPAKVVTPYPDKNVKGEDDNGIDSYGGRPTDETAETYQRVRTAKDGRVYTPYERESKWYEMTEEEKAKDYEDLIPVLQDKERSIDRICTRKYEPQEETYAFVLTRVLSMYCEEEGIHATEGEYIAYGLYLSKEMETFYIELNDPDKTVLLCYAEDRGKYWKFEKSDLTKEQIREQAKLNEIETDNIPKEEAAKKTPRD